MYLCKSNVKTMKNLLYTRPEKRQFRYKPRFNKTEEEIKNDYGDLDPDKLAERLHRSWSSKRKRNRKTQFPLRTVIWLMFIVIILVYFFYRFMM